MKLRLADKYNINLTGEKENIRLFLVEVCGRIDLVTDEWRRLRGLAQTLSIETLKDIIENQIDPYYAKSHLNRWADINEEEFNIKIEWEE